MEIVIRKMERPASAKEAGIQASRQYLPITLIGDGRLFRENLALSGKDEAWLGRVLQDHAATLEETFLLTVDGAGKLLFLRKETV